MSKEFAFLLIQIVSKRKTQVVSNVDKILSLII